MNERIKLIREAFNLNQAEFAQKIGLGHSTLGMMEVGKRNILDRHIKTICSIFDVSENWLRYGTGNMLNETQESFWEKFFADYTKRSGDNQLDEIDKDIVKTYFELPLEYRKIFRDYLKAIVDVGERNYLSDLEKASVKSPEQKEIQSPPETVRVLRAADSISKKPPELVDMPKSEIEELRNAPKVTSMDDI